MLKLAVLFKSRTKTKKIHRVLEFNESRWLKSYVELNTQKVIEAEKNRDKVEKLLYRLMDNAIYGKAKEDLKNKTDERLLSNTKDYISQKSFENNFMSICKKKVTLTLRKPTYVRMHILNLSKVLMYKFHYD